MYGMSTFFPERFAWLKKHVSTIAFFGGFIIDTLTLGRVDAWYDNALFVLYLVTAFLGILLVHAVDTGRFAPRSLRVRKAWLPALVQFPIGGLFSGFLIFYVKSASFLTSWFFLALLLVLFVGNEFLHKRYERLVFQVSMFYFALFSYLVLLVPTVLGEISTSAFLLSGLTSLFLVALLVQTLMRLFPDVYRRSARHLAFSIGGICLLFNVLYFANIIPPVPLALKGIGIYHSVVREQGGYRVTFEEPAWYAFWRDTGAVFHRAPGEAAYCFSAVFAPTSVSTDIYHAWMRKNKKGDWVRENRTPFPIQGGRDGGYRGYTIMHTLTEGEWRCVVETERGQVLGETRFQVEGVSEPVTLTRGTR